MIKKISILMSIDAHDSNYCVRFDACRSCFYEWWSVARDSDGPFGRHSNSLVHCYICALMYSPLPRSGPICSH